MVNLVALALTHLQAQNLAVYAELPENVDRPVGRIEEAGEFGPTSHMPDWLTEMDLQVDAWGNSKSEAFNLARQIQEELRSHPSNQHGAITRMAVIGMSYEPDEDWPAGNRPGPRYVSLIRVNVHPPRIEESD